MTTSSCKPKLSKSQKGKRAKRNQSLEILEIKLKFCVLIFDLFLAGISIIMRVETPVVWTFLYGIGGWAALTAHPKSIFR